MAASSLLTMTFNPVGDLLEAAQDCELEIFNNVYGNTRAQWVDEYGPYEDNTAFIAITNEADEVVAASRLITPGPAGLKSLNDVSREPWKIDGYAAARAAAFDPEVTIDVATIAVRKGLKGSSALASIALHHGLNLVSRVNALPNIVMIMDARARRLLSAIGLQTTALPGAKAGEYLGSANSLPLWGHTPTMLDTQRMINPDAHRLVSLGVGLDGISVPPAAEFSLNYRRFQTSAPAAVRRRQPARR